MYSFINELKKNLIGFLFFLFCLNMIKVITLKSASPTSLVGLRQFHGTNFGDFLPVSTVE